MSSEHIQCLGIDDIIFDLLSKEQVMKILRIISLGICLLPISTLAQSNDETRISAEPWHMGGAYSTAPSTGVPYSAVITPDDPHTLVADIMYHLSQTLTLTSEDPTVIRKQIDALYADDLTPMAALLSLLNMPLNLGHAERFWQEHGSLFLGTWPHTTTVAAYTNHLTDPELVIDSALREAIMQFNELVKQFLYAHPKGVSTQSGVSVPVIVGTCAGVAAIIAGSGVLWWWKKTNHTKIKHQNHQHAPHV